MTGPWICWLYQYAIGGVVFFGALGLAVWTGAAQLEVARNRRLVALLFVGYFALAAIHAGWIAAVTR
jgi:hypothetical protein